MAKYTIKRDGERPLVFKGEEIGNGDNKTLDSTRWTQVTIYRTAKGRFVAEVERLTQWQGESDFTRAESFDTFPELIEWLKDDNGGPLGAASQEAIDKAVENCPELESDWVEEVE